MDEHTKQIMDLYAMGVPIIDTRRIFAPSLWKLFKESAWMVNASGGGEAVTQTELAAARISSCCRPPDGPAPGQPVSETPH